MKDTSPRQEAAHIRAADIEKKIKKKIDKQINKHIIRDVNGDGAARLPLRSHNNHAPPTLGRAKKGKNHGKNDENRNRS